jgi:glucose/arabinose dehydrogenase
MDRLFVVEQHTGNVRIIDAVSGQVHPTPFLTVGGLSTGGEQGLLGLAFHPNYAQNGFLYVNFTNAQGATVIRRYQVSENDPNRADPASSFNIMSYAQPFANHNGGWMGFGPVDGYLYISSGDGGSANDPGNRAQDITDQKLGKMLRLDVDGDDFPVDNSRNYAIPQSNPFVGIDGDDEIWGYGLRNPWRAGFDRATGDLYIGDVGQGQREEIDFQPAGSPGGENYGWRLREGTLNTGLGSTTGLDLVDPIHEYSHTNNNISVTGGYVYRGNNIGGDLAGTYFFADFGSARIWTLRYANGQVSEFTDRTQEFRSQNIRISQIASFGEDAQGNLYVVSLAGSIFRFTAIPAMGDADGDGDVDLGDFAILQDNFGTAASRAEGDVTLDGVVDLEDFSLIKEFLGTDSRSQQLAQVPEPSTWLLMAISLLGLLALRRPWTRT